MIHDILGDLTDTLLTSNDGLHPGPFAFKLLFLANLFTLGRLFKIRVDLRAFNITQFQLGQTAFVEDAHRGAVVNRLLNVINIDIIPEHSPGVLVLEFNRRAGKADERRIRKSIAHMSGKTIDKVVLTPVGLIRDHHNIAPVGKARIGIPTLLGEELLNGRKNNAAGRNLQTLSQQRTVFCLNRSLP